LNEVEIQTVKPIEQLAPTDTTGDSSDEIDAELSRLEEQAISSNSNGSDENEDSGDENNQSISNGKYILPQNESIDD
jgi:hypothetical protein